LPHLDTDVSIEPTLDPPCRARTEAAVTVENEGGLLRGHAQRRPVLGLRP
jgi:hypothetical protein